MSSSSNDGSSNAQRSAGLPAPLTLPACDLSDFAYMELDVRRLRDSKFAAAAEGEAFRAGILLWCAAWHQVPAASLPDDDVELANLAGYGRVLKEWKKVRAAALHGFVKCADGRLYHPVVAEKAIAAFAAKEKYAYEKFCDRLRKENAKRAKEGKPPLDVPTQAVWKAGACPQGIAPAGGGHGPQQGDGFPPEVHPPSAGNPPDIGLKGSRKERSGERDREGEREGTDLFEEGCTIAGATGGAATARRLGTSAGVAPASRSGDAGAALPPQGPADGLTRDELWSVGKSLLQQAGMPKAQCGSFVGRLCKDYGNDIVIDAVRATCVARPADPAQYLKAICMRAAGQRGGGPTAGTHTPGLVAPANRQEALEQRNRSVADAWAAEVSEAADCPQTPHPTTHGQEQPHAAL